MSILMGPYDKEESISLKEDTLKDIMVFGYQSKLYHSNDTDLESLLIPWMGDNSLMVDRYDIRNHFDDKVQFGIKPNLPYHMTVQEEEMESLLNEERYASLGNDIAENELVTVREERTYSAIGFSYNDGSDPLPVEAGPLQVEHPPTTSVDIVEDETDMYYDPPTLITVPFYIERPYSKKFQSIIEKTALFVSQQGQQMEIIIKTKQKYNPQFSFLHHEDRLFPYYKQLLHAITDGTYTPTTVSDIKREEEKEQQSLLSPPRVTPSTNNTNNDNSESEDEMELHPLLRTTTVAKRTPPSPVNMAVTKTTINSAPSVIANNEKELQPNTNKAIHDLQPIVDRTADYVAKNGVDFQRTVINRHIDDRRFDFLHPWNEFHNYYKMRVEKKRQELQDSKPLSTQPLTPSGSVSFKLTNNTLNLPIGVVDHLNFDPVSSGEEERTEQDLTKRQKLSIDSSGQIDSEFKKFLSTVKAMLK